LFVFAVVFVCRLLCLALTGHADTVAVLSLGCCVQARHRNPKTPELWLAAIRTEQRAGNTKAAEALLAKGMQVC
jgi:pre-mRNA-processing factor 6